MTSKVTTVEEAKVVVDKLVSKFQVRYRIAGNFRMVEIFVYKFSLHNNVNMFYVTMLSCTNI